MPSLEFDIFAFANRALGRKKDWELGSPKFWVSGRHFLFIFSSFVPAFISPGSISSPGWRRGSVTPRVTTIPCPGCQHDIDLGERGISMLFRNFTLESIVERYRQAARAAVAIMCNICKPPQLQEATKSCMDCKASYCNECFKLHHPWGTPKAQHEYVGPTTNFRPKVSSINMCEVIVFFLVWPILCSLFNSFGFLRVVFHFSVFCIWRQQCIYNFLFVFLSFENALAALLNL